jgi:hypothetical protein
MPPSRITAVLLSAGVRTGTHPGCAARSHGSTPAPAAPPPAARPVARPGSARDQGRPATEPSRGPSSPPLAPGRWERCSRPVALNGPSDLATRGPLRGVPCRWAVGGECHLLLSAFSPTGDGAGLALGLRDRGYRARCGEGAVRPRPRCRALHRQHRLRRRGRTDPARRRQCGAGHRHRRRSHDRHRRRAADHQARTWPQCLDTVHNGRREIAPGATSGLPVVTTGGPRRAAASRTPRVRREVPGTGPRASPGLLERRPGRLPLRAHGAPPGGSSPRSSWGARGIRGAGPAGREPAAPARA